MSETHNTGNRNSTYQQPSYFVLFVLLCLILSQCSAEMEWQSGIQRHACCVWHGWSCVRTPNLHQCLQTSLQVCGSKKFGCHADLFTVSRCHTRGESQEFIAHRWQSMQVRDPSWLWNPGETLPKVQNRGISGPTKRAYVLQNLKKRRKSSFKVTAQSKRFNITLVGLLITE